MLAAIRAQESGGNYAEDAPNCLGAYCWGNQASWDTMAAAAGLHQFVGKNPATLNPTVQDQVASGNLGRIYGQTHSLTQTLEWWNGGATKSLPNPGLPHQSWAKNCGGGTTAAYACQVEMRMKLGGHYLAEGSGSGGTVQPSASADCLIGFGGIPGTSWIQDIFGSGGNIGQVCLFTKSEARAIVAVTLMWAGAMAALPGLFLLVAGFGQETKAGAKVGQATERVGAAVAVIPGAEGVGAGVAAVGKGIRGRGASASRTRARRQARNPARAQGSPANTASPRARRRQPSPQTQAANP